MKKKTVIIIASVMLMALVFMAGCSKSYINDVKSWRPYRDYGINATVGTVFEKYLSDCTWTQGEFGNGVTYFVNANGKIDGESARMRFEVNVSGSSIEWQVYSFTLGDEVYDRETSMGWFEAFFDAYEAGAATLPEYFD
ncbi:MAG: hypothetical protein LBQ94_07595 [Treponema sp.]|jgi:hypothetical protein|nr:hypothetical protein [Treponema sp.]